MKNYEFFLSKSLALKSNILKTLLIGSITALVINSLGAILGYLSQVLLARWMTIDDYGAYAYANTWLRFLTVPCTIGLATSVLRFIPQYMSGDEWALLRGLVQRSRQIVWLCGFVVASVAAISILLAELYTLKYQTLLLAFLLLPFFALASLQTSILRGVEKIALAYSPLNILKPVLLTAIVFIAIDSFGKTIDSINVILILGVVIILILVIQNIAIKKTVLDRIPDIVSAYDIKNWFDVSLPLFWVSIFTALSNSMGVIIAGIFLSNRSIAIYHVAARTSVLVGFVLGSANAIIAPMFASAHSRDDTRELKSIYFFSTLGIFSVSFGVTILLWLLRERVLGSFGEDFLEGQYILGILILGNLVSISTGPVGQLMNLTGFQKQSAHAVGGSVIIGGTVSVLLANLWDGIGIAMGVSLSQTLLNIWLYFLAKRHHDVYSPILSLIWLRSLRNRAP